MCYSGHPLDREEEPEEGELTELRLKLSDYEHKKLAAIRRALKGQITKAGVARLIIAFGVEHDEQMLAWYGQRSRLLTAPMEEPA